MLVGLQKIEAVGDLKLNKKRKPPMKLRILIGLISLVFCGTAIGAESSPLTEREDSEITLSNPLFEISQNKTTTPHPKIYALQNYDVINNIDQSHPIDFKFMEQSGMMLSCLMSICINFPVWIETLLTCAIKANMGMTCTLNPCNSQALEFHPRACEIQREADNYIYVAACFMVVWSIHSFYDRYIS